MQSFACSSKWLAATVSRDSLITSLSFGAEQFTGYSPQELVGRPITQILADPTAFQLDHILEAANQWGHWQGEMLHRTRAGKEIKAQGIVTLLAGGGNHAAGYLVYSNLTEESDLPQSPDSVTCEIAGKLRVFSHDLNNPLAVVMGFAQLLMLNPNCQGTVRKDVEKLFSELKRVIQVVENLHAYAISMYGKSKKQRAG